MSHGSTIDPVRRPGTEPYYVETFWNGGNVVGFRTYTKPEFDALIHDIDAGHRARLAKLRRCSACHQPLTCGQTDHHTTCGTDSTVDDAWTDEQWDGRARMALARQAAGAPLDPIDHEAINRPTSKEQP